MYELTIERTFSAAHYLRDYEGPCARLHGHNYRVEITIAGTCLQPNGMLLDFSRLKQITDEIIGQLDHRCLNDLPAFVTQNTTAENIAAHIYHRLVQSLADETNIRVARVRLWESDTASVTFSPEQE